MKILPLILALLTCCSVRATTAATPPVSLVENDDAFVLDNGALALTVEKKSGAVVSLIYRDLDLVKDGRGYWSKVGGAKQGPFTQTMVRTDPKNNGGERAEIACRAPFDGAGNHFPVDVELRYALGRGERGFYAYAVWDHKPAYPAFTTGEARFLFRLNPTVFDGMTIDADRRGLMPTPDDWNNGTVMNMKEVKRLNTGIYAGKVEHKYDYSAVLPDTPAFGWSSTQHNLGLWFINPSYEFIADGPTKVELTGHLDVNAPGSPVLLDMWLGSHYGGSPLTVAQGEAWTKVIGPIFVFLNSQNDQDKLWRDALNQAKTEAKSWPYHWVNNANYPLAVGRGSARGRIVLRDPVVPDARVTNLRVGLTAAAYPVPATEGFAPVIEWQRDSKNYQFWTRAESDGRFDIRHIRPGTYTLHAFGDGVLGEFARADITVKAGEILDLGDIMWTPFHYGKPLWQIGVPDRTAREFRHGDDPYQWGLYLKYPQEFPDDVNFVIGKSDPRTDWNYAQPPRILKASETGVVNKTDLRPTTWTIRFDRRKTVRGLAVLRLAFCGSRLKCNVAVSVNGKKVGETGPLPSTGVMHRDGIQGYWYERAVSFDASRLKAGKNQIQLQLLPATDWPQGVLYDCVRLELRENTH